MADLDFLARVCCVLDYKIEDLLEYQPPGGCPICHCEERSDVAIYFALLPVPVHLCRNRRPCTVSPSATDSPFTIH